MRLSVMVLEVCAKLSLVVFLQVQRKEQLQYKPSLQTHHFKPITSVLFFCAFVVQAGLEGKIPSPQPPSSHMTDGLDANQGL